MSYSTQTKQVTDLRALARLYGYNSHHYSASNRETTSLARQTYNYHVTHFVTSAPDIRHLPADIGIEVAFAGRSNAGKSSALNTLTNQKSLARTSKTP